MEFKPPIYNDTDSCKQALNAVYGCHAKKIRNYICVIADDTPTVIFKDKIVIVTGGANGIGRCIGDTVYFTKNSYSDVVKMLV